MDSVHDDGGIEGEYQTGEPKQQAESHTGAVLQEPSNAQSDKKRRDKHDCGDRVALCFGNGVEHQAGSISKSRSLESRKAAATLSLQHHHFGGAMISHAQPARKQSPPTGVTGPSQSRACGISAMR